MRVVSVHVGMPRTVEYRGREVRTGIFKQPAKGRVRVLAEQLEGDGQADRENHGGPNKAIYAYPREHYAAWEAVLGRPLAEPSQFGENLTVEGALEDDVQIGDVWQVGSARLVVAQPRKPCFKLGIRLGDAKFPKLFFESARVGFYLRVLSQGDLGPGDAIERLARGDSGLSVAELWRCVFEGAYGPSVVRRALTIEGLAEEFRGPLLRRIEREG